jgi:SAM-dependent methyltransferase
MKNLASKDKQSVTPAVDERRRLDRQFSGTEISYHELADFYSPQRLGRVLDYGCGSLRFAHRIVARATEIYGIDVASPKQDPPLEFMFTRVAVADPLPFPPEFFDTVFLVEVIEHVPSESIVLEEVVRVMKYGATLVITTPHRGLLTGVDPGNWKFCVPRVHRWIHVVLFRNRAGYDARFGADRPEGLVGDITGERHKHYSLQEFMRLVPAGLRLRLVRVSYPAMRLLWVISVAGRMFPIPKLRERVFGLRPLRRLLSRSFGPTGDQLLMVFEKA